MKKLALLALLVIAGTSLQAQTVPSHEQYVKIGSDTQKWYQAYQNWNEGEYLYKNDETAKENENFFISRVKRRDRFTFAGTQVNENLNSARKLLWWCPIGVSSWNALPAYFFNGEVFSMWSYVDIYGNWTAPMIQAPAAFLDVCHKNGVSASVVAAITFGIVPSPSDEGEGSMIAALYDGGYDKLLKYLHYYGVDGIGWNSEFLWNSLNVIKFKTLLNDCFTNAAEYGVPGFNNIWYGFTLNSGGISDGSALTSDFSDWFHYNGKITSNAYFLNSTPSYLSQSQETAKKFQGRSSFDVYAGINCQAGGKIATFTEFENYELSLGLWGAHNTNMMYTASGENGSTALQKKPPIS